MEDKKLTEETVEEAVENAAEDAAEEVTEAIDTTVEIAEEKTEGVEPDSAAANAVKVEAGEIISDIQGAGVAADEEAAELAKAEAEEAVSEEVAEAIDTTVEIAEEMNEDNVPDSAAADEVTVEAGEIISDIIVAGGASSDAQEKAEKAEKEKVEADIQKKGAAVKEPPIIKKKSKLNKTNVIVIAVCAAIVVACFIYLGFFTPGWFKGKPTGSMTLGDYSEIEVLNSDVEVSDEMVDQYVTSLLQSQATTEQVTEGVVEDGDTLNIDFVGKLKETGEEFDGGSAQGQSLTIGSGRMIDGFESGLIGAKVGETTTIEVTFPEDYQKTELAGKDATFDITVNYKEVTNVPELTDDFVKTYSKNYLDKELSSVKELEEYAHDYIYDYYLHNAIFEELQKKQTVTSYDEEMEAKLMDYSKQSLDYYASMYGTTADQYAAMYGAASADAYALDEAHYYLDTAMLVDKIIKDKKIKWTDEDFNQAVALYMARNGYSEKYTVEEFLENSGETWRYLFENLEFKFNLAMEALEPNVKFVDQKSDAETESAADNAAASGTETETTTAAE